MGAYGQKKTLIMFSVSDEGKHSGPLHSHFSPAIILDRVPASILHERPYVAVISLSPILIYCRQLWISISCLLSAFEFTHFYDDDGKESPIDPGLVDNGLLR